MKFHQGFELEIKREEECVFVCVFFLVFLVFHQEERKRKKENIKEGKVWGELGWGFISKTKYHQRT
jgi:hypothetical protein